MKRFPAFSLPFFPSSGPLFSFDVHDDIRLVNDATVEKDEVRRISLQLKRDSQSLFVLMLQEQSTHRSVRYLCHFGVTHRVGRNIDEDSCYDPVQGLKESNIRSNPIYLFNGIWIN